MDEAQGSTSELIIFLDDSREERHEVRKAWYDGRFYFSVVDIIAALKVSQKPPRQYWAQLKEKVKDEGFPENYMHLKRVKGGQRKRRLESGKQGQTDHTQDTLF